MSAPCTPLMIKTSRTMLGVMLLFLLNSEGDPKREGSKELPKDKGDSKSNTLAHIAVRRDTIAGVVAMWPAKEGHMLGWHLSK